jgi:predicted transcriptional regulator
VTAPPAIPDLERLVLEEIWRQGTATVRSVRDAVNAAEDQPERAYTTFLTIFQRLDAKGLVLRSRDGRTDHFSAALSREAYLGARAEIETSELLEQYGELALVQFARRVDALDPERRAALRRLAEQE